MGERCSSSVSIPAKYDGGPTDVGAVILSRTASGESAWSPRFKVDLGGSGHVRWWCNSTTNNALDPATWIRDVNKQGLAACVVATGVAVATAPTGAGAAAGAAAVAGTCANVFTFGSSVRDGWTPERSRCGDRSTWVRARLGRDRKLEIERLGR